MSEKTELSLTATECLIHLKHYLNCPGSQSDETGKISYNDFYERYYKPPLSKYKDETSARISLTGSLKNLERNGIIERIDFNDPDQSAFRVTASLEEIESVLKENQEILKSKTQKLYDQMLTSYTAFQRSVEQSDDEGRNGLRRVWRKLDEERKRIESLLDDTLAHE